MKNLIKIISLSILTILLFALSACGLQTNNNYDTSNSAKTADDIITNFNEKVEMGINGFSNTDNLLVSHDKQESTEYGDGSYSSPNKAIQMIISEYGDNNTIPYAFIDIDKSLVGTDESTLKQICYCLAYAVNSDMTEDEFTNIWSSMANSIGYDSSLHNAGYKTYPNATYYVWDSDKFHFTIEIF